MRTAATTADKHSTWACYHQMCSAEPKLWVSCVEGSLQSLVAAARTRSLRGCSSRAAASLRRGPPSRSRATGPDWRSGALRCKLTGFISPLQEFPDFLHFAKAHSLATQPASRRTNNRRQVSTLSMVCMKACVCAMHCGMCSPITTHRLRRTPSQPMPCEQVEM